MPILGVFKLGPDIWSFNGKTYDDQSEDAFLARSRWTWRRHRRRANPLGTGKPHIRAKMC